MAEAVGKATGEPGIAMVTRGPGASNAFVGVHLAWQDSSPGAIRGPDPVQRHTA